MDSLAARTLRPGKRTRGVTTVALDPSALPDADRMLWLSSFIAPRPVLAIGTFDADGAPRVAPFSSVLPIGTSPLRFAVGIHPRLDGGLKATLRNVQSSGELTAHVVHPALLDAVVALGAPDRAAQAPPPAELAAADGVRAPRWTAAAVQLECRVDEIARLAHADLALVVVDVVRVHVAEDLLTDGRLDAKCMGFVGHLDALPPRAHAFLIEGARRSTA